ncbi:MAG TPA: exodeoxyribonuclease V subunit alpha [Planctomycetota bacterium]|nr:exodeoxyribonuclease V subunit alpha [Planctomycetota bacterium]
MHSNAHSAVLDKLTEQALANGLQPVDIQTIADICELSGRRDEEIVALLTAMFLCLREGSVCLEVSHAALLRRFDGLLDPEESASLAEAIIAKLQADAFLEFAGSSVDEHKPVILQRAASRTLVYFQKYLKHERVLQQLFHERLKISAAVHPRAAEIVPAILAGPGRPPGDFSDEQKLAIALALLRNFLVVSGGPGTGKTSVVFAVLRALLRTGLNPSRIALACPTGRAAQRLTESIRAGVLGLGANAGADSVLSTVLASTLHRLLGYNPSRGTFSHHRENTLPFDVVVVDELSMVDIVMMSRLMEAVPPQSKLILLGDKNQLPSVDAGSVLSDLMPRAGKPGFSKEVAKQLGALTGVKIDSSSEHDALRDSVVILQKNFRSQKHICNIAAQINALPLDNSAQQAAQLVSTLPRVELSRTQDSLKWPERERFVQARQEHGGCWFLPALNADVWSEVAAAWAKHHYQASEFLELAAATPAPIGVSAATEPLRRLFEQVQRARILTLVREGPFGCVGVNRLLSQLLRPGRRPRVNSLFAGAPVLITSNDYTLEIFNGDVGIALHSADHEAGLKVVFERQDEHGKKVFVAIPSEALPTHELAFAMTVHKSQGSEYSQVLLALPDEGAQRLLNRQMIYTAITRAKELAVICGRPEVLGSAISRTLERTSGLDLSHTHG